MQFIESILLIILVIINMKSITSESIGTKDLYEIIKGVKE